ncbi:hypothetical protein M9H77_03767 [Catharanthus roseus]|uniref:Uncharacterized protein n=1 Tax=Catharanthus roseus TaxID=4058 RepID=A0ACC0CCC8_CATRO|nr:hypothetical protein M9H77_03767 [Catharanthus roseus]
MTWSLMRQALRSTFGVGNQEGQRQGQTKEKLMESSMSEKFTKVDKLSQAQDVVDGKVIHHEKKNTCTFVKEEKSREEKLKSDKEMCDQKKESAMEDKRRVSFNKEQSFNESISTSLEECECEKNTSISILGKAVSKRKRNLVKQRRCIPTVTLPAEKSYFTRVD